MYTNTLFIESPYPMQRKMQFLPKSENNVIVCCCFITYYTFDVDLIQFFRFMFGRILYKKVMTAMWSPLRDHIAVEWNLSDYFFTFTQYRCQCACLARNQIMLRWVSINIWTFGNFCWVRHLKVGSKIITHYFNMWGGLPDKIQQNKFFNSNLS